MHVAQVGFVKGRNVVSTIAKNTSCNNGWLRLVVQMIFGTLIVSSFILIMLMVFGKPGRRPGPSSRCSVTNCRVICNNVPYYGDYEEDIINAASEADAHCESIVLKLIGPTFKNFQIPQSWLWSMSSNVRELAIVGGNMKQIAPDAFMSPFGGNIRILIMEEIEINVWEKDMLVGLSNLEKLLLIDCILSDIRKGALAPVDDSLQFLDIKSSNIWDPANITGSTRLLTLNEVDFSSNNFRNNLGNASFSKLRACKVLFLNSCQIVSLEAGTFDYLENIQHLYLNDNLFVTLPVGLFDRILPHQPRITLHDNLWHCDCSREDLRNIIRAEVLIVDPVCHSPVAVAGMAFSDFEGYCKINYNNDENISKKLDIVKTQPRVKNNSEIIYMNGACDGNVSAKNSTLQFKATPELPRCLLNRMNRQDFKLFSYKTERGLVSTNGNWIKPVFFVQNNPYSMVEIASSALPGFGLLWYQSSCAHMVYCVNTVPHILKVFNVELENYLTFCPFNLSSGTLKHSFCVSYNLARMATNSNYTFNYHELIWFVCLSVGCLTCGAICVYGMIQRNPTLLKGSKRVLVVKHRSVEALILPPKLPMRKMNSVSSVATEHNIFDKKKIFVLPHKPDALTCHDLTRSISMKSNESNDASYISALQPTEEQLTEWRTNKLLKQLDKTPSSDLSMIPYTSMYGRESFPYYSCDNEERIYEVPKQY
ncbi:jg3255 [Pararge aegeria aegeria]|uniref:Jg3255 protein n=1 Tax=Pararge aegeria aegeria TaxID=348720 RepID=A0A8S4RTQ2_9NEOP|nr:jg3255 [Pararge aegeria aegeria]CAH2241190.1 jg3255 [Pararge aegeria aegeria]